MKAQQRVITVMCDSLRRDFISPMQTPVIQGIASKATCFARARGVFPSTTRTSSASIATGCYPARHGLTGNCVVLAEPEGLSCRNVGDPAFLDHLRQVTGTTLKVPTVAAHVRPLGRSLLMSNVSAGAAYFHDPEGFGEVWHRAGSFGEGRVALTPNPAGQWKSGADGDAAMTAAFCGRVLGEDDLICATLWLSNPDHSGHRSPIGSPEHLQGIRDAEACLHQVEQMVAALRDKGDDVLFIVASDHGMQSIAASIPVTQLLVDAGFKADRKSREVVIAPNGTAFTIGVSRHAHNRIPALIDWLKRQEWTGEVLAGAGLAHVGLADEETCRIAVSMRATDHANAAGVPGTSYYVEDPDEPGDYVGRGQHGGLGTYEQSPFLLIDGKEFEPGVIDTPVSLVDFLPTMLRHLGLPCSGLDGRPLQHLTPGRLVA